MARRPRNVMAKPLAISASVTLVVSGLAALLDLWPMLGRLLMAGILVSLIFVVLYTVFALRDGWIASIGHRGQVHHHERRKEPLTFWCLALLYLVCSLPAAWYLLGRVITG